MADGWHSEVGWPGAAAASDALIEAGEFPFSGLQADLKTLDLTEPPVYPCLGNALTEVVDDLGEAGPLLRRHTEHRAAQASVLMLANRTIRTAAGAQRHLPQLKVLLEIRPFLVGGLTVLFGWPGGSPRFEERAI